MKKVVIGVVTASVLVILSLKRQRNTAPEIVEIPAFSTEITAPFQMKPPDQLPVVSQSQQEAIHFLDEEQAWLKKAEKHIDLRWLEESPAKDTPEAKRIEEMLAKRGVSRAAVPWVMSAN